MSKKPDLTVIVVSYNTREMTLECLRSLYDETPDLELQVILVDNNSADGSAEAIAKDFPQVELHARKDNLGFAGGNNVAAKDARADWLLLLNPDTVTLRQGISKMYTFAKAQSGEVVVGGRTYYGDGSLNPTSCWGRSSLWSLFCMGSGLSSLFRRSAIFDPESLGSWARDTEREVDIVTGCLLMLPTELWRKLDGFDLDFFMYGEDADLCLRAQRAGARCVICPDATIVHYAGQSEKVRADKMVRLFTAKSQLFKKHGSPVFTWFAIRMLDFWAWTRMAALSILKLVKPARRESYESWRDVWRQRATWRNANVGG